MVADGMGGAACGEIAATLTVEETANYLRSPEAGLSHEQLAKEAIRAANRRVRQQSQGDEKCRGMGSTVVMVLWRLPRIVVANVGDSRAYLWRPTAGRDGQLRQISYDQTLQNQLRRSQSFTEEQLRNMGHKNVLTMAVGSSDEVLIQTMEETLEPGDQVLLCSDGLWGGVSDYQISTVFRQAGSIEERVKTLIQKALAAGGHDNTSVVILAC